MIRLERGDCRRWRLSRVASIRISGVDFPARERCHRRRGLRRLPDHRLGLRRRASLHRRHLGDPLGRWIIVEQRHDVDFALGGTRRSRSGLLLGWRDRRNDGSGGRGNGHPTVLLLHRHRCLSWHARHGPVGRSRLGRLRRRLTEQRTHWLRVDRRRIRLRNGRRRAWRFGLSRERRHLGPSSHDPLGRLVWRVRFGVMQRWFGLLLHPQRRAFDRARGLALSEVQPLSLPVIARRACLLGRCK